MPTKNNLKFQISNFKFIDKELKQVQAIIEKQLKATCRDEGVKKLISSFDVCSGKMIRPALVLLAGGACGKINDRHIRIASIVELLHNATLLHDDVIDEGRIRRGRPTVNSLFGNESAVLLGDFLLSRCFKMCAKFEPEVLRFITSVTASICEGELRQTIHRKNYNLSEEEYLQIITDKSASLFESCCFLGAFLAGADEKEKKALADFGLNFGIAFQLADDLVDIIGDENKSEKTLGSDVSKNKPTLALICLLRRLSRSEKKKLILKLNNDKIDTKALRKMIESKGSANYVRSQIALFTDRAVVKLRPLKDSIAKKALIETAKFINRLTA